MAEILFDDDTPVESPEASEGARGLLPREPAQTVGAVSPFDIPLIPRIEWPERIREMEANRSRLSDIILTGNGGSPIPSKNQNDPNSPPRNPRWGYCWFYGPTGALEAIRAVMNLPYVPLSAFAGAYVIKKGRDEGGWGALALDFLAERGVPSEEFWPNFAQGSRHDTPETWANAALHKVTESWADLKAPVYDRDLTLDQKMTLLLNRVPVVDDYMWWGHCVYSCDPLDFNPGAGNSGLDDVNRWGSRDRNSWGDSYGDRGFFKVRGRKSIPDNAVAPRATLPSTK